MSIYNRTYAVGDTVTYNVGGGYRTVVVTEKLEDVKNGRPGFDGRLLTPEAGHSDVWGYDDQIVSVQERGSL